MAAWPFAHNWTTPYKVTVSFLTTVLTSQSGREQRVAERGEPRRVITTEVLEDGRTAQAFDRFLWSTASDSFDFYDPTTGLRSIVRLDESETVSHPTAKVAVSSVTLSVEPGYENPPTAAPDALSSFAGRYVFPFPVNWSGGRDNTLTLPRRTADFGRGRIAVSRPITFNTRVESALLLRVGQSEIDALTDFYLAMRGRQGEFWCGSLLMDMDVLETVSTTVVVDGADAAGMFDEVNCGITLLSASGNRFRRRVLGAAVSGSTTLLQLDRIPPTGVPIVSASWLRLSRFASDDLTVEWTTSTVAQSQVQTQTLPYADPEVPLDIDPWLDYFGPGFFRSFVDPLDYLVNHVTPKSGEWPPVTG